MAEASLGRLWNDIEITSAAAYASGEVIQVPTGHAGVIRGGGTSVGSRAKLETIHHHSITKLAGQVWVTGCRLWWDHSANGATCVPPTNDRDFYLGLASEDAASADTTGTVNLGAKPEYIIDIHRDGGYSAIVKTSGAPSLVSRGGTLEAAFSETAEAQKLDWLSKRSFPVSSNWVLEALFEVVTNADADVADLSIGVANATHASDADAITESCFLHLDMGGNLNLYAESDDGTTEVNPTDTTLDWATGSQVFLVIDGRNEADIQIYVNGVNVLASTVFKLDAATGPLKALFHLEKSSNDSPGVVHLDHLTVRTSQQ